MAHIGDSSVSRAQEQKRFRLCLGALRVAFRVLWVLHVALFCLLRLLRALGEL